MSAHPNPHLKCLPTTADTSHAETAPAPHGQRAPKVVGRQAVPIAVRPDPQTGDGRHVNGWLHVVAPQGAIPTATSVCDCGRNRSAVGRKHVIALVEDHTAHRDLCPLRTASQEGRTAA